MTQLPMQGNLKKFEDLISALRRIDDETYRRDLHERISTALFEIPERYCEAITRYYGLYRKRSGRQSLSELSTFFHVSEAHAGRIVARGLELLHRNTHVQALYKLQHLPEYIPKEKPPKKERVLWENVPEHLRMNEACLLTCGGVRTHGAEWVQLQLSRILAADLQDERACRVATLFGNHRRYMPCCSVPAFGEIYCVHHGGKRRSEVEFKERLERERIQRERDEEHAQWAPLALAMAHELQRRTIDRLHEQALTMKDDSHA